MKSIDDICNVESEAGIIATALKNPEYTFYSENLRPNHFTVKDNAFLYYAICELAKRGIEKIDAYNITNLLNAKESTKKITESLSIESINETVGMSDFIARHSVEEYMLLVDNVLDMAFRRDAYKKLEECKNLCFSEDETEIENKIYSALDDVVMNYATVQDVPEYKNVVDDYWEEIVKRQQEGNSGIPFKFPELNKYVMIEPSELVIFAAEQKQGKSIFLLNCAADLLRQNKKVLYIDSELNSRMFTCRLISHLTQIEYRRVRDGNYTDEEAHRIRQAIEWLKTKNLVHKYVPMFDQQTIFSLIKKVRHTQGLDVLIIDYFKSSSGGDAYANYNELGRLVDMIKNDVAGAMNIAAIGAAQATASGKLADSAKIARNASTICSITQKSPEEIQTDGAKCGNKKLRVIFNRSGMQMAEDEYIDLQFNGNLISYEEAEQHDPNAPY